MLGQFLTQKLFVNNIASHNNIRYLCFIKILTGIKFYFTNHYPFVGEIKLNLHVLADVIV